MTGVFRLIGWSALVLGALLLGGSSPGRTLATPPFGAAPGRATFDELGIPSPIELSVAVPERSVTVTLPADASQGDRLWFGARIHFVWSGSPQGSGARAYLFGKLNGHGFYQFKTKMFSDLGEGFEWSMVDLVSGESRGFERFPEFRGSSTNFFTLDAVQPGPNQITFALNLEDARTDAIRVKILPDSELIATDWQPAEFVGEARGTMRPEGLTVTVSASNVGWPAPFVNAELLVFLRDGQRDLFTASLPSPGPSGRVEWQRTFPVSGGEPQVAELMLDWGTGRKAFQVWPPPPSESNTLARFLPLRTVPLVLSFVALWVSVPALVRASRTIRG